MHITIRPAQKADFDVVPELMLQAMEDIVFSFINQVDIEEAINFLTKLYKQPNTLYSYENTFVAINDEEDIVGSVTGYNGDRFEELRQPLLDLMQKHYQNDLVPEAETEGKEYYIDTVAVSPIVQGKGVGSHLLKHIVDHAKEQGYTQVGLLVDLENPNAKRLYSRLGFELGKKIELVGGEYYHMYIRL
ncbi:MAG: GNAT family N-acetyltransferase [Flavobacteriaceae bacterium]|jgi:ribosomal protein S18 acetylase RimI-like enzyme|nr:GNAT family N-acetyltransferase [Flavobacteriaceae bacterium]